MLEHAILRERFEEILEQTHQARRAYELLAGRVANPAMREQLQHVCRDKLRHVCLAERLLEIAEA